MDSKRNKPLKIGSVLVQPGERLTLGLPTPELSTCISMHIPIHVIHGRRPGPCLLVSSAMHGDGMNGIAIIHKLLGASAVKNLRGTLIAVPALNVYGLMTLTRNLPDRRDLDGSFPGSKTGSFAARLAHHLSEQVLNLATHCIDIHSGHPYQQCLPHVQTQLDMLEAQKMARALGAPVTIDTPSKRGLLWQNAKNIPTLIYQTGEPLRLDDRGIKWGYRGILRVLQALDMVKLKAKSIPQQSIEVRNTTWLRANGSGLCQLVKKMGGFVRQGEHVADIYDPFGTTQKWQIHSPQEGVILTRNTLPLVNEGDPIVELVPIREALATTILQEDIAST